MAVVSILITGRNNAASAFRSVQAGIRTTSAAGRRAAQQLQRDYDAANRNIDQITRSFNQARQAEARLTNEAARARDRVADLSRQVSSLGGPAPAALARRLDDARQAADRAGLSLQRAQGDTQALARSLNHAQNNAQQLARSLRRANAPTMTRFGRAVASVRTRTRNTGEGIGEMISGNMREGWKKLPAELKGVVIGAGVLLGITFANAAGAAAAGVLTVALGGGVLAAGVALAAKQSDAVQSSWRDALKPMIEDVKGFASVFEGPLIAAAGKFRQAWAESGDAVGRMFSSVSTAIGPLVDGLIGMVQAALPGIEKAVAASVPLLKDLGAQLPKIGKAFGDFFAKISKDGDGAMKGLRLVVGLVITGLQVLGSVIAYLSSDFDRLTTGLQRAFDILSHLPVIGDHFARARDGMGGLNDMSEGFVHSLDKAGPAAEKTADGTYRIADAAKKAADAVRRLSEHIDDLVDKQLSVDEANLAWHVGMTNLIATFKEHGRTLDINSEAGQENLRVIQEQIRLARESKEAAIEQAGGQNASREAVEAANAAYQRQIGELEATLKKMGLSQAEIDKLIGRYRELADMPNITKYFDLVYRTVGNVGLNLGSYKAQMAGTYSSGVGGRASGGIASGIVRVGERGEELLKLPAGTQVINHETARRQLSGGGGGGDTYVTVSFAPGGGSAGRALSTLIGEALRTGAVKLTATTSGRVAVA